MNVIFTKLYVTNTDSLYTSNNGIN